MPRRKSGEPDALRDLRSARKRRFLGSAHVMEFLYRAYLVAIFGGIALAYLANAIDEAPVDASALRDITLHGPAVLGVAIALAVLAGLRAGSRGGPLGIEEAEVQYVLLGPVDRGAALRPAALRQLRVGALAGCVVGVATGAFAIPRLPGAPVEWLAALGAFGAIVPLCYLGAALLGAGRRLAPMTANAAGATLLAWALVDLLLGTKTSPATMLGDLATLPLQGGLTVALAAVGVLLAAGLAAAGLLSLGGLSLEAARRRAQLAAELRFSAAVQDLRTVVLLRRQLASELPRRSPWLQLPAPRGGRGGTWRRGWRSFLRWPAARLVRVVAMGALAGLAAAGAWSGTPVLVVGASILLMVAALDLVEPLAQEIDHPIRRDTLPVDSANLIRRHLPASVAAMAIVLALGVAVAAALGAAGTAVDLGALMALPTSVVLVGAAAFSAGNDPYRYILVPQINYVQTGAPVVLAAAAVSLPILVARHAAQGGKPILGSAFSIEVVVALFAAVLVWFVGWRVAAEARETA
jgi:hypothetical protein